MEKVDASFNTFHDIVCIIIDKHSLVKSKTVNAKKFWKEPWITKGLQKCICKQKQLYQDCIKSGMNLLAITKYKEYRNLLVKFKRGACKEYYATNVLNSNKLKKNYGNWLIKFQEKLTIRLN